MISLPFIFHNVDKFVPFVPKKKRIARAVSCLSVVTRRPTRRQNYRQHWRGPGWVSSISLSPQIHFTKPHSTPSRPTPDLSRNRHSPHTYTHIPRHHGFTICRGQQILVAVGGAIPRGTSLQPRARRRSHTPPRIVSPLVPIPLVPLTAPKQAPLLTHTPPLRPGHRRRPRPPRRAVPQPVRQRLPRAAIRL